MFLGVLFIDDRFASRTNDHIYVHVCVCTRISSYILKMEKNDAELSLGVSYDYPVFNVNEHV